jgi:hypothetical protein
MKNILCIIAAAALMCGCNQQRQVFESHAPVSGAFGWYFGDKFPAQLNVLPDDDGSFYYTYETNGLFQRITVNVNEQREICMVRGFANTSALGPFDMDTLVETLSKKYGLTDKSDGPPARSWGFGKDGATVHLTIMEGKVTILYRFDKLLDQVQQKHDEQKNQEFRKSINGV